MKRISLLLCLGFLGCAAVAPNLNAVSLEMTKAEVIKILGSPTSVSAKENVEYLKYTCGQAIVPSPECNDLKGRAIEYFVRLVGGKVESYGKVGDFDSAKNPANDINLNVKTESK